MKTNKIIIVDPSPVVTAGLLSFFEGMNNFRVVSVVDNLDDLQDKMIVHNPDILMINPVMFGYSNQNFIKQMNQNYSDTICVAIVTSYIDKYLLKNFKETVELCDSKQKVVTKMLNLITSEAGQNDRNESVDLSNREIDVLVCIAKGMTNKDVSDMLNISVHTVITHRKNIVRKTGIKSVSGLTVYALLNNYIEETDIYE